MKDIITQQDPYKWFNALSGALFTYENLIHNLPIMCILTDVQGTVLYRNQVAEEAFLDLPLGSPIRDFFSKDQQKRIDDFIASLKNYPDIPAYESMVAERGVRNFFWQLGVFRPNSILFEPICTFTAFSTEDLQHRIEEQLLRHSHITAMTHFSGRLCHEVNNPLAIAIGNMERIAHTAKFDTREKDWMAQAQRALERIQRIMTKMTVFHNFYPSQSTEGTDLRKAIDSVLNRYRDQLKSDHIDVEINVDRGFTVKCAERHLQTVIDALVCNASDACNKTKGDTAKKIRIQGNRRLEGTAVLQIQDNGCGMTKEVQARLFDPFFSTKDLNQGLGLDMTIIFNIVKAYKGSIDVTSESGRGTMIKMIFPG